MSDSQAIPDEVLKAQAQLAAGRISRRDFLRSAGRLGISASAASVLAACGAPAAPAAPVEVTRIVEVKGEAVVSEVVVTAAPPAAVANTNGVLWGLKYDPHVETYKRLADMFLQKSGITLAVEPQAWPLETKLFAAMAAGTPPDVICIMGKMCTPLYIQKALLPLKDLVYAAGNVDPEKDFIGDGIGAYSWNGDIFGVPTEVNGVGSVVNVPVDDVKALGLDQKYPPTNGQPWFESYESMFEFAKALQVEKNGKVEKWGLSSKGWDNQSFLGILRTLLKPDGVDWWDNNNKKFMINTEQGVKAMQMFAETPVKLGIETEMDTNQIDAALAGKVALARGNGTPAITGGELGYNYLLCGVPKIDGKLPELVGEAGWGFVAPSRPANPDASVKFLQMMATEEGQMGYSAIYGGIIPAWKSLIGNYTYFKDSSEDNPNVLAAKLIGGNILAQTKFYGEQFGYAGKVDAIGAEIASLVRSGKLTAAEAVASYQERAEEQYKQYEQDVKNIVG